MSYLSQALKVVKQAEIPHKEEPLVNNQEAFDPIGYLTRLLIWAKKKGASNEEVAGIIDQSIELGILKEPWGIKVKGSHILGDYWIVSSIEAAKLLSKEDIVFTGEDIKLLSEIREIFNVQEIRHKRH